MASVALGANTLAVAGGVLRGHRHGGHQHPTRHQLRSDAWAVLGRSHLGVTGRGPLRGPVRQGVHVAQGRWLRAAHHRPHRSRAGAVRRRGGLVGQRSGRGLRGPRRAMGARSRARRRRAPRTSTPWWGSPPKTSAAVGDWGTIYRYDGSSWVDESFNSSAVNLYAVAMRAPNDLGPRGATATPTFPCCCTSTAPAGTNSQCPAREPTATSAWPSTLTEVSWPSRVAGSARPTEACWSACAFPEDGRGNSPSPHPH